MKPIAQFPLKLVVFPKEVLRIHIFEERYQQLLADLEQGIIDSFGIPFVMGQSMSGFGTLVSLNRILKRYKNGRSDIELTGQQVFKIDKFHKRPPQDGYSSADIILLDSNETSDMSTRTQLIHALESLTSVLGKKYTLSLDPDTLHTSHFIHKLGLDAEEELRILLLMDEEKRQKELIGIVEHLTHNLERAMNIRNQIEANGHIKNLDILDLDFN